MKINKKIIVPVLSTVMGLSLIGGVSGAVAWYQYNSRVTASFIAMSSANSGLLQISGGDGQTFDWKKDYGQATPQKLIPVTFGSTMDGDDALPSKAYSTPEAGAGNYTSNKWQTAVAGTDYIQFDIYLQALQLDNTDGQMKRVQKSVYLSDLVMNAVTTGKEEIVDALRLHLAVDGGSNFLISKTKVTNMGLSGYMDLDGDGADDTVSGYVWEQNPEKVLYGIDGATQTTKGIADVKSARDPDSQDYDPTTAVEICKTKTNGAQKITVTAWLEGWTELTPTGASEKSKIWDVLKTDKAQINIGMEFDVGRNAFIPE